MLTDTVMAATSAWPLAVVESSLLRSNVVCKGNIQASAEAKAPAGCCHPPNSFIPAAVINWFDMVR